MVVFRLDMYLRHDHPYNIYEVTSILQIKNAGVCDKCVIYSTFFVSAHRPPVEQIYQYLDYERDWILPKLFDGIDPDTIAHLLASECY